MHFSRRRRLPSKEFEDVSLDTGSGSLLTPDDPFGHDSPRRRVHSMTSAQKPNFSLSPRTNHGLRKTVLHSRIGRGGNSSGSSRESLNKGSITSLDNLFW